MQSASWTRLSSDSSAALKEWAAKLAEGIAVGHQEGRAQVIAEQKELP